MKITDTMKAEAKKLGLRILTEEERKRRAKMRSGKGCVWNHGTWDYGSWFFDSPDCVYALPASDKFFAEQSDKCSTCAHEYEEKPKSPLVKVWAIDKQGENLPKTPYQFRGEPDWERINEENEGAEAIVVWSEESGSIPPGSYSPLCNQGVHYYVLFDKTGISHLWHSFSPVPAIVAAIKKRKVKFNVGDYAVNTLYSERKLVKITSEKYTLRYKDHLEHPTRSDFEVKRNGHTWLAVEDETQPHEWLSLYCDGEETPTLIKIGNLPKGAIKALLNLPVCPAGIK